MKWLILDNFGVELNEDSKSTMFSKLEKTTLKILKNKVVFFNFILIIAKFQDLPIAMILSPPKVTFKLYLSSFAYSINLTNNFFFFCFLKLFYEWRIVFEFPDSWNFYGFKTFKLGNAKFWIKFIQIHEIKVAHKILKKYFFHEYESINKWPKSV